MPSRFITRRGWGTTRRFAKKPFVRELKDRGKHYERQKLTEVIYKGKKIEDFWLDLVIKNKIVVELKSVPELPELFEPQALSYLKATGLRLGIFMSFGCKRLENMRVVN